MCQDWTPVFPQPHSQMVLVLTSVGIGGYFRGKQWEAGKLRGPPGSPLLPAQSPTIGPMQTEVIIWEMFGITVIVLSVPDSHKIHMDIYMPE